MKTIEDIRKRDVAVHNDGTLEQLIEVLGIAFPNNECFTSASYKYYYALDGYLDRWDCSDEKPNLPIQSVKDFLVKEETTKEEMENNKQEYELVDFEIEDLKVKDVLIYEGYKVEVLHNFGKVVLGLLDNHEAVIYSKHVLKEYNVKLQVSKPKLEKIQGFEVREYPELPLVEVGYEKDFSDAVIRQLAEVQHGYHSFYSKEDKTFMYCRPVPKDKRNFIEID